MSVFQFWLLGSYKTATSVFLVSDASSPFSAPDFSATSLSTKILGLLLTSARLFSSLFLLFILVLSQGSPFQLSKLSLLCQKRVLLKS